jgi:hypothetical protein
LLKKLELVRVFESLAAEIKSGISASMFFKVSKIFMNSYERSSSSARWEKVLKIRVELVMFEVPGRPV